MAGREEEGLVEGEHAHAGPAFLLVPELDLGVLVRVQTGELPADCGAVWGFEGGQEVVVDGLGEVLA